MKRFFVGRTQSSSNASFMTHMFIRDLGERRDGIASVPESGIINSIEFVEPTITASENKDQNTPHNLAYKTQLRRWSLGAERILGLKPAENHDVQISAFDQRVNSRPPLDAASRDRPSSAASANSTTVLSIGATDNAEPEEPSPPAPPSITVINREGAQLEQGPIDIDNSILEWTHDHSSALGREAPSPIPAQGSKLVRRSHVKRRPQSMFLVGDIRRLFQECKIARSDAKLLSEALAYATKDDLEKEKIREFYSTCKTSQELIFAQIPRATARVERSWASLRSSQTEQTMLSPTRNAQASWETVSNGSASQLTAEEELLASLIQANGELLSALKLHRDINSVHNTDSDANPERSEASMANDSLQENMGQKGSQESQRDDGHTIRLENISSTPMSPSETSSTRPSLYSYDDSIVEPLPVNVTPEDSESSFHNPLDSRRQLEPTNSEQLSMAIDSIVRLDSPVPDGTEQSLQSPFSLTGSIIPYSTEFPLSYAAARKLPEHMSTSEDETTKIDHNELLTARAHDTSSLRVPQSPFPTSHSTEAAPLPPDLSGQITKEGDYPPGRGGFADVWKCIWRNKEKECKVAVKILQARSNDATINKLAKRIRRELRIWQKLKHENVLPLLGTAADFGQFPSLVSPWLDNGNLIQYLENFSHELNPIRRLQIVCEVANGLTYLHSSGVVHGDLTGANVLITDEGKACLCDFGLSNLVFGFHGTSFYTTTAGGGNVRWAAPEIIYGMTNSETNPTRAVTTQSDVYSFGSIMLETFTGRRPYHYLNHIPQIIMAIYFRNKPHRPTESCVTDWIWEKINQCWADCPEDRPCMTSISESLRRRLHNILCLRALQTRTPCEEEPSNRGPGSDNTSPLL